MCVCVCVCVCACVCVCGVKSDTTIPFQKIKLKILLQMICWCNSKHAKLSTSIFQLLYTHIILILCILFITFSFHLFKSFCSTLTDRTGQGRTGQDRTGQDRIR